MLRENDVVLDVGANRGQYAEMIRSNGYRGRIVSFEPLSDAYAYLARKAVADQAWEPQRVALGDRDGTTRIHISSNSCSSSLFPILERHVKSAPESAYVGTEIVPIARLDSILRGFVQPTEHAFLKIDTQGSELQILRGAQHAVGEMSSVEVELSLLPLYAGQGLITDVVEWLDDAGFALVALKRGHRDLATGMILQLDGLFARPSDRHRMRDGHPSR
jgi:FkbM family methyltransferase